MPIRITMIATMLTLTTISSAYAEKMVFRIGTETSSGPFVFLEKNTLEFTGFDIDLINAVAKASDFEVQFIPMSFDELIAEVQTGSIDLAISCITITEDRQKRVSFSKPYIQGGLGIMIHRSMRYEIQGVKDLQGHTVCAQSGTLGYKYINQSDDLEVLRLDTDAECYQALKHRHCDAFVNDMHVHTYYLSNNKAHDVILLDESIPFSSYEYGIAMNKHNTQVQELVNSGLEKIMSDGTYKHIYDKWFRYSER